MASAVVIEALDNYWNPYTPTEDFVTVTERLMDRHYDEFDPEIDSVNLKSADKFWRGTADPRSWKPELNRTDVITTPAGYKLYPSFDRFGNRLMRWFDSDKSNITFQFSVNHLSRTQTEWVTVRMYHNTKTATGYWRGKLIDSHIFMNPYSELTEQRCTYWMMAKLNRSLSM